MKILDLVKKKFLWILLGTALFYVLLIAVSDIGKISESFLQIRAEFIFLIFGLGFLAHVIKSFRQKDMLGILVEKITPTQNMITYMLGLSLVATPGSMGTHQERLFEKNIRHTN